MAKKYKAIGEVRNGYGTRFIKTFKQKDAENTEKVTELARRIFNMHLRGKSINKPQEIEVLDEILEGFPAEMFLKCFLAFKECYIWVCYF